MDYDYSNNLIENSYDKETNMVGSVDTKTPEPKILADQMIALIDISNACADENNKLTIERDELQYKYNCVSTLFGFQTFLIMLILIISILF